MATYRTLLLHQIATLLSLCIFTVLLAALMKWFFCTPNVHLCLAFPPRRKTSDLDRFQTPYFFKRAPLFFAFRCRNRSVLCVNDVWCWCTCNGHNLHGFFQLAFCSIKYVIWLVLKLKNNSAYHPFQTDKTTLTANTRKIILPEKSSSSLSLLRVRMREPFFKQEWQNVIKYSACWDSCSLH